MLIVHPESSHSFTLTIDALRDSSSSVDFLLRTEPTGLSGSVGLFSFTLTKKTVPETRHIVALERLIRSGRTNIYGLPVVVLIQN